MFFLSHLLFQVVYDSEVGGTKDVSITEDGMSLSRVVKERKSYEFNLLYCVLLASAIIYLYDLGVLSRHSLFLF